MSESILKELICGDRYLVCVGTELRSDDAAGLRLCELLVARGFPKDRVIMCEFGLENCMSSIEESSVKNALVVDAALVWGREETPNYFIASLDSVNDKVALVTTHSMPIKLVIELLRREELFKDVWVLGIVARNLNLGEKISPEVQETINYLADLIIKTLSTCSTK
ncbi:MAG: hydrogenase maturation protease [Desulfurococcaceae archaeon TW002]